MTYKFTLGDRVRQAREHKGSLIGKKYTGESLARELGISRGYLGDIETGRKCPSKEMLIKISAICGVSLDFFEQELNNDLFKAIQETKNSKVISTFDTEIYPIDDEEKALVKAVLEAHRENKKKGK